MPNEPPDLYIQTINLRFAAVRRLAYEAADVGLLSPDLPAVLRKNQIGANVRGWPAAARCPSVLLQAQRSSGVKAKMYAHSRGLDSLRYLDLRPAGQKGKHHVIRTDRFY